MCKMRALCAGRGALCGMAPRPHFLHPENIAAALQLDCFRCALHLSAPSSALHPSDSTVHQADPAALEAGLPNQWCPSDHLPVAATFRVSPAPRLSEAEAKAFMEQFKALGSVQMESFKTLESQLQVEQREVEACVKASQPPEPEELQEEEEPAKKKNKSKGKVKPPPEVMAFMQKKRQRERELKAELRAEREQFVAALSEKEHDMLDTHVKVIDWIEQGAKVKK